MIPFSKFFILIVCLALVVLADDFKTINGKEYENVKVSRVEPDGIVITFSGGIVKIPFTELSPEIQKKYDYDPQAAADFQQQRYQANVLRARQLAGAREKQQQELEALSKSQPQPSAAPTVERQSTAESLHGSSLDRRPGPRSVIYGRVLNVVDEGSLITVRETNIVGTERIPDGATVLFLGNFPNFYDDDRMQAIGIPVGRHECTARAFEPVSMTKLPCNAA